MALLTLLGPSYSPVGYAAQRVKDVLVSAPALGVLQELLLGRRIVGSRQVFLNFYELCPSHDRDFPSRSAGRFALAARGRQVPRPPVASLEHASHGMQLGIA
jgi:hypothetical protein